MTAPALNRRLLSVGDAAAYLSVGKRTMESLLSSGEVLKVRIRSRTLVDQADLDAYVERIKAQS
jgi:excisionase family DNA binding protein